MSENQTKEEALCRAMAMLVDGTANLEEALKGYEFEAYTQLTDEGKDLINELQILLHTLQDINAISSDTIDEAARMSGLDITEIGYEGNK